MARTEHFIHRVLELQEARFDFALDCLHHANNIRSGNIAFSPYSLYEGLTMIYFASSDGDTDTRLKYVLKLPDDILKSFWVTYNIAERMKENREDSNGFYNQNICWINKAKQIKDITSIKDGLGPSVSDCEDDDISEDISDWEDDAFMMDFLEFI
ncbi:uncharacterized protein LOC114940058 [Nylanderia fulva]|uniref:uncharacterized protein LOC114940058 n=1 Tax=Nylanderia fulva TaxID=613905 RepID=UPI0010FAFC00|nr:uncharacterized protein LOC114940058 [Nylanderia fulva]